jgi:hypothetical protein
MVVAKVGMSFCVALVVMQGITPMNMLGRVMRSMMSVLALAQVSGPCPLRFYRPGNQPPPLVLPNFPDSYC